MKRSDKTKKDYKINDKILLSKLTPIQKRRWTLHLLQYVIWGVGWSAIPTAVFFAIERLYMPVYFNGIYLGLVTILLGIIGGFVFGLIKGEYSILGAAVKSDEVLGLKEIISTAVVLESRGFSDPISKKIKSDAHSLISNVKPAQIVPLRFPIKRLFPVGLTCLSGLLLLLPPLPQTGATQRQKEFKEVKMMAKPLQNLAEQLEKMPKEFLPQERKIKLTAELKSLAKQFEAGRTPKKEALKKLNSLEQKLADELKNQSPEEQTKKLLENVSSAIKKTNLPNNTKEALEKALKSMNPTEEIKKQLSQKDKNSITPSRLKEIAEQLKKQAEQAAKTGEHQLAKDLEKMASELNKNAESLQAIKNDTQKILDKMQSTTQELSKELQKNNMFSTSNQLNESMKKNIDEFNKNGELDMQSLKQMNEAMKPIEKSIQEAKTPEGKPIDKKSIDSMQKTSKELQKQIQEASEKSNQSQSQKELATQNLTSSPGQSNNNTESQQNGQQILQQLMKSIQDIKQGELPISDNLASTNNKVQSGGKQPNNQEGNGTNNWGYGTSNKKIEGNEAANQPTSGQRNIKDAGNKYTPIKTEKIYDPKKTATNAYDTQVKGEIGKEGEMSSQEFTMLPTNERGSSKYYQTVNNASRAAENSMETEDIPNEYRELVRNYFLQLKQPEKKQKKSK